MNDRRSTPPSVAIIGSDATLAAMPATPVQLAHACLAAGFDLAVPVSWGDELVAAETFRRLASPDAPAPAVMCACPHVTERLLSSGEDLAPFLVSIVAPPVAVARYLRAVYDTEPIAITYIGSCPAATASDIDRRLTPMEFFASLENAGILLNAQPLVFDSIVPPDRRRYYSAPGGVPTPEMLHGEGGGRSMVELDGDDFSTDLAQLLIARERVLIDVAPRLGCACSGAITPRRARAARLSISALEPPRASSPVIDATIPIELAPAPVPERARANEPGARIEYAIAAPPDAITPFGVTSSIERREPVPETAAVSELDPLEPALVAVASARRKNAGAATVRHNSGGFPKTRSGEGRALPRAYVARRRTSGVPRADTVDDGAAEDCAVVVGPQPQPAGDADREIARTVEPAIARVATVPAPTVATAAMPTESSQEDPIARRGAVHAMPSASDGGVRSIIYVILVVILVALGTFIIRSSQTH